MDERLPFQLRADLSYKLSFHPSPVEFYRCELTHFDVSVGHADSLLLEVSYPYTLLSLGNPAFYSSESLFPLRFVEYLSVSVNSRLSPYGSFFRNSI